MSTTTAPPQPPPQPPPVARGVGGFNWKQYGTPIWLVGGGVVIILVSSVLWNSTTPPLQAEKIRSASEFPAAYRAAPAAPPVVQTAPPPATPAVETKPTLPDVTRAPPPEPPRMAVTFFRRSDGQMPEYLKPKPPVARPTAGAGAAEEEPGIVYKAETIEGSQAFVMKDPDNVLPEGTLLSCIMDTAIITGVSGDNPFRCRLDKPGLSATGKPLLDVGTWVSGKYTSVVTEGQARIVATTMNARTPQGIVVSLGGPVADPTGAAGIEGSVDNHWLRRLGPALILSLLDAGTSIAQSALQGGGSGNTTLNLGGMMHGGPFSQVTQSLLQQQMSIPPTIKVKQGEAAMLWVTRYTSFSKVYRWR